jgi:predicted MFS family arabinose efflux permease
MATRRFQGLAGPVFASIAITFAGIVIMYLAPTYIVLLAVMALFGIPHGMTFTLGLYMVARTSGTDERNASNSFYSSHYGVANVLVPLATGYLAIIVGIHVAFLILLVPSALLALSFLAFFRDSLGPPGTTRVAT